MSVLRAKKTAPSSKWRWYPLWLNFHLYLGLSLGLVFVLAGLTGSLLVFYVELDEVLNPELQISAAQSHQPRQSLESIYTTLTEHHPQRTGAWRLEMPRHNLAMMMARYYKAKEKEHLHFAPLIAWINPYTAEIVSSRFWGDYAMTWLYDLHYELLLDKNGKIIMAIIGLFLLMNLFTGLYLWWPKLAKFKTAVSFKTNASTERFNYDLHKLSGVYGFIVLFLLLVSGIILELPEYVNPALNRLSPLYKDPELPASSFSRVPRISVDRAVELAQTLYPKAELRWVETPRDSIAPYRVQLYQDGEPSRRFPKTMVWLDQYSGKVLAVREPASGSTSDTFLSWMHPLHSGEIAGLTGRIIILACGLLPLILFYTGVIRWFLKRKAKRRKSSSPTKDNLISAVKQIQKN